MSRSRQADWARLAGAVGSWQNAHSVTPTVLRSGPYRLFFFSSDSAEPAHIHVEREGRTAKFWLDPVTIAYGRGFNAQELGRITRLVEEHRDELVRAWHDFFGE